MGRNLTRGGLPICRGRGLVIGGAKICHARFATVAHKSPECHDRDCGMPESGGMRRLAWHGMGGNMPLRGGLSISQVRDGMLHRTIAGLGYGMASPRSWRVNDTRTKRLGTKPEQTGSECGTFVSR